MHPCENNERKGHQEWVLRATRATNTCRELYTFAFSASEVFGDDIVIAVAAGAVRYACSFKHPSFQTLRLLS